LGNEEGDPWAMKKKVLEQLGWGGKKKKKKKKKKISFLYISLVSEICVYEHIGFSGARRTMEQVQDILHNPENI
jgi:hypothetical protein